MWWVIINVGFPPHRDRPGSFVVLSDGNGWVSDRLLLEQAVSIGVFLKGRSLICTSSSAQIVAIVWSGPKMVPVPRQ